MTRRRVLEPGWPEEVGYSRALRVGGTVWVAGTTAGGADVVKTRIYVTDIGRFAEVGRAHAESFAHVRPAATMVEVSALVDPRLLVEIEAVAVVG